MNSFWGIGVVCSPLRDFEVVVVLAHSRLLHLWNDRGALLLKLIEVCEDRMGHKLRPKPQNCHAVRVQLGDDLGFGSQEAEVVLLNKITFVLLILPSLKFVVASNVGDGEWATRTLIV